MNETIGNRIRRAREEAGLTQLEVGELLGVTKNAITKIEAGQSALTLKNLFELPRILHKPISYFLGVETDLTADEAEWLEMYRVLLESEKKHALQMLRVWLQMKNNNVDN